MNEKADILDTKFYKGIINSKAAMTYAEAQARLNVPNKSRDPITDALKGLSMLAQILKKKRFDNG
jgi:exosome complex exonuclease DIS3/RRP44